MCIVLLVCADSIGNILAIFQAKNLHGKLVIQSNRKGAFYADCWHITTRRWIESKNTENQSPQKQRKIAATKVSWKHSTQSRIDVRITFSLQIILNLFTYRHRAGEYDQWPFTVVNICPLHKHRSHHRGSIERAQTRIGNRQRRREKKNWKPFLPFLVCLHIIESGIFMLRSVHLLRSRFH